MKIHLNSLNAGPNNVADILNNFIKLNKIILKSLEIEKKKKKETISTFLSLKRIDLGIKIIKFWRKLIISKIDDTLMDLIIPVFYLLFNIIENILKSIVFILNPQQNWELLLKDLGSKKDDLPSVLGKGKVQKHESCSQRRLGCQV